MLKRKAFIHCIVLMLLLYAQWCYGQDIADTTVVDTFATVSSPKEDTAVTTGHVMEALYTPVLRRVPDSTTTRFKADKNFAYANDPAYWRKKKEEPPGKSFWYYVLRFMGNDTARVVFYLLLAGVLVYALYRVVLVNKLFIFYSPGKGKVAEEGELGEISDENMDDKIQAAMNGRDYRTAVRYLYLKVLRELHHKGYIHYHAQATNDDYIRQMSHHPLHTEFGFLTRVYDYVWYGGLEINETQFASVYDNFQNFYRNTAP